jgi:hypothetical protein
MATEPTREPSDARKMQKDDGDQTCRYCGAFIRGARIHWWCRDLETKGK